MLNYLSRLAVVSGLLVSMLASGAALAKADLRLYGSNTVGAELGPAMVKKWLKSKGYDKIAEEKDGPTERFITASNTAGNTLTVEFDSKGSSTGFRALEGGEADIGMSSRPIKTSEVVKLKKQGHCDTAKCEYVIALDGIAIIVNPSNPLTNLNKAQLKKIFSGEVTNWSDIGGKDGAIKVYSLDDLSGTYDTFKELVLGKSSLVSGAIRNASHQFIAEAVASDTNAIGFVGLPFINGAKAVAVADGEAHAFKPGSFTVATEDYVLARRLFMYLPENNASPLAHEFMEYAISGDGQAVVGQIGFVSQEIVTGDVELDANMPKEYRELAAKAHRLSLNFRFLPASIDLDNKAQRDVKRLKEYMAKHKGRLMLFGFADTSESLPIKALQLSVSRADRVADLLAKDGMTAMRVRGYGSAVPVASNSTEEGRHKNRRVEVWMQ